jgi:hypothetical protein
MKFQLLGREVGPTPIEFEFESESYLFAREFMEGIFFLQTETLASVGLLPSPKSASALPISG